MLNYKSYADKQKKVKTKSPVSIVDFKDPANNIIAGYKITLYGLSQSIYLKQIF